VVQGFEHAGKPLGQAADTDRRAAVQTIAERAESLARLVDQLLLGSRAGANRLAVNNEPFDLAKLLIGAAKVFRPLSDRHTLVALVPDDLPEAHGDPAATDSIVSQLLENAFKYSPDGGTVTIAAAEMPETSEVEFPVGRGDRDRTGRRQRVFERFVQGEAGDRAAVRRYRAWPIYHASAGQGRAAR
jgi:signal transduction histidine kinase